MHPLANSFLKHRYLFLLVALLALLVLQPIASTYYGVADSLFDTLFALVIVVLTLGLARARVWRVVAFVLCILAAALAIGGFFTIPFGQVASEMTVHAIGALFFVAVAGKIVGDIFTSHEHTLDSIFGAICGYLLLGVAWSLTYAMIHTANSESFQFGDSIRQQMDQEDCSQNIFVYYSFVTLSTVGYGDISPLTIPARTASWLEAITGQLYLAVLIAGLISSIVTKGASQHHEESDSAGG